MRKKKEIIDALEVLRMGYLNSVKLAKKDPYAVTDYHIAMNKSHIDLLEYVLGFDNEFAQYLNKYMTFIKKARVSRKKK